MHILGFLTNTTRRRALGAGAFAPRISRSTGHSARRVRRALFAGVGRKGVALVAFLAAGASLARSSETYSWRYYRPGNTGVQGDFNEAIWIGPDGDPWIGGYDPIQEEGGVAKFIQAENRWLNVSNVDYPVIGSQNDVGGSRVTDMVEDAEGFLWMGTWRGVLKMNPVVGPSSLVRYGPGNSALPGGVTDDIARAPDGTIWISAYASAWGGGGLTRYNPGTHQWTHLNGHGGGKIATQTRPGGGYYLWATGDGFAPMERWSSTTQTWTSFPATAGHPAHLVSLDSVDDAGNVWMTRWFGVEGQETVDCLRPDGTWITPSLPPMHPQVGVAALRAFGNLQCLLVNGYGNLYRFNGTSWADLGPVPHNGPIDDLDIDEVGNVWLCGSGTGGAARRDAETGSWQRYRITNTSQFDGWNHDLAIDPNTGDVYATANAASGVGGMVKYDGQRWSGWVSAHGEGLTGPWPWDTDNSEAVYVRPSNGQAVVNPLNNYTHEWDGTAWSDLPGGFDQMEVYVEDSLDRLWGMGHYGGMGIFQGGSFNLIDTGGWSGRLQVDPSRAGTVWANEGWKILRTDGSYSFSRVIEDFPELVPNSSQFGGLAVEANGSCWVSSNGATGGVLLRIDPTTGTHQLWQRSQGWPFPGDQVEPLSVTPDGKVWMAYSEDFPGTGHGLFWWDGAQVGVFPQQPGAFNGFPDGPLVDLEVKSIPGGYELWMCITGRGIAVLQVLGSNPASVEGDPSPIELRLDQNHPNPVAASTLISWSTPTSGPVRLTVFDVAGRAVRRLMEGEVAAGRHESRWDGLDEDGRAVSNGVYFYRLEATGARAERRMIVLR